MEPPLFDGLGLPNAMKLAVGRGRVPSSPILVASNVLIRCWLGEWACYTTLVPQARVGGDPSTDLLSPLPFVFRGQPELCKDHATVPKP